MISVSEIFLSIVCVINRFQERVVVSLETTPISSHAALLFEI